MSKTSASDHAAIHENPKSNNTDSTHRVWLFQGLFWGVMMFVFMGILHPLSEGTVLTTKRLVFSFIFWMVGGLAFGFLLKAIQVKWGKK